MSDPGKPISDLGFDGVADRFRESLDLETNKPDFRELDLGSPVSPLRTRRNSGPATSGITTTTTTTTTTTSSSSSSSGSLPGRTKSNLAGKRSDGSGNTHSGELSGSSESSPTAAESRRSGGSIRNPKASHSRSGSSGSHKQPTHGGSVNSPPSPSHNILPAGNICPSGKIVKTGMASRSPKTDVVGSGTGIYGHGSIMRGSASTKLSAGDPNLTKSRANASGESTPQRAAEPEELKRAGNEQYKRGHFAEALSMYNQAISMSPGNASYRSNRAATLVALGRLGEAVKEWEEAVRLDPLYWRAQQRLGSLFIRLGQVENARRHLFSSEQPPDPAEVQKLLAVEKHLDKCTNARKINDWKSTLRECDAAITAGAENSPQIFTCRAESLLKLNRLDDAISSLSSVPKSDLSTQSSSQAKFFGFLSEAYLYFVEAQIELAFGRFENAITCVEKATKIDPRNIEVAVLLKKVRLVARARARGNELFKSERLTEACSAYEEGLKLDRYNAVLYCNRAACWYKLGQWDRSIDDCNQALGIQPNYVKALLRRAASNNKLERWVDAVRDYEALRKELPNDNEIAENLFHAQVALKKSRGEDVRNMKFGGEVEEVSGFEKFKAAISSPCVSVVHFKATSNVQSEEISPFVDKLCARYPSVNFLKIDVEESPEVASIENVRIIPTFKIYKNGIRVKEMICPSREVLDTSVRHYSSLDA